MKNILSAETESKQNDQPALYPEPDVSLNHDELITEDAKFQATSCDVAVQTPNDCDECKLLINKNRILRNKIIDLQSMLKEKNQIIKKLEQGTVL